MQKTVKNISCLCTLEPLCCAVDIFAVVFCRKININCRKKMQKMIAWCSKAGRGVNGCSQGGYRVGVLSSLFSAYRTALYRGQILGRI
jgi:hypothetical protein